MSKKNITLFAVIIFLSVSAVLMIYSYLSQIEVSLPVATVSEYQKLSLADTLITEFADDLNKIENSVSSDNLEKLALTMNKSKTIITEINKTYNNILPDELSPIIAELINLIDDVEMFIESDKKNDFEPVLLNNNMDYIENEFKNYIIRVNNKSIISLDKNIKTIRLFKNTATLFLILIIISQLALLYLFINKNRIMSLLKEARIEADRANSAKSDFLANMSHEIRTPMNAVIGFSCLMKNTVLNKTQQDYISKILNSANTLLEIINDILDFSKIEAGKIELEEIEFSLSSIIDSLTNIINIKVSEKKINFVISINDEVPEKLVGDPLRLKQILLNLVNNAVKFTDEGEIVIDILNPVFMDDNRILLEFSVRDTGIGISEDNRKKLFQSFTQADSSVTRKYGGSGLGLTICKKLTSLMGGDIWIDEKYLNGSKFCFSAVFRTGSENDNKIIKKSASFHEYNVLIVDPGISESEILKRYLNNFGFKSIEITDNGYTAISKFKLRMRKKLPSFDIIFIDSALGGLSCSEVIKYIDDDNEIKIKPEIVVLSNKLTDEESNERLEVRHKRVILKPLNPSVLFDTLVSVFSRGESEEYEEKNIIRMSSDNNIEKCSVLVVEDNEINQEIAKKLLELSGVDVFIANNGKEAVDIINMEKNKFDAVLMDIHMPVMDGFTATEIIKKNPENIDLPVIAMTADISDKLSERIKAAGMVDYVTKPVYPEKLYSVLSMHIDRMNAEGKETDKKENKSEIYSETADPEIVDVKKAVKRLNGDGKLFTDIINNFTRNYTDIEIMLKELTEPAKREELIRFLHTVKGLSGTIGADSLSVLTASIEERVKNNMNALDEKTVSDYVDEFRKVLKEIKKAVKGKEEEERVDSGIKYSNSEILSYIIELKNNLELNKPLQSAEIIIKLASSSSLPENITAYLNDIHADIDNYDFDKSHEKVLSLIEIIKRGRGV